MKTWGPGPFDNNYAEYESASALEKVVEDVAYWHRKIGKHVDDRPVGEWPPLSWYQMARADIAILLMAAQAGAWVNTDWHPAMVLTADMVKHPGFSDEARELLLQERSAVAKLRKAARD
jgi:hypothetical protein